MKKIVQITLTVLCVIGSAQAKKIKFAVDMAGQTISPNGVHVAGDFQAAAGYIEGDWSSTATLLTQEDSGTIYSIVLDIPAFHKYEYKFVNGDQFYEVEFVPVESRVGYDFNDNRWLYVDSLQNDTTFVGAILFSGNAPAGMKLFRYYVDMSNELVSADGVHVRVNSTQFDPSKHILYSFLTGLYETILYTNQADVQYAFVNGKLSSWMENVPEECSADSLRYLNNVDKDTLLTHFCFSGCGVCPSNGTVSIEEASVVCYPNPVNHLLHVQSIGALNKLVLMNVSGQLVLNMINPCSSTIDVSTLKSGLYWLELTRGNYVERLKINITH